jgi:hypothetical protein
VANILDIRERKRIIDEILSEENKRRKEESYKRYEIWKSKHGKYILDALTREFSAQTVKNMRTVTSVNIVRRIVNAKSSIYRHEPKRTFENASEETAQYLEKLYQESYANIKLKKSNKIYALEDQAAVQIIPKDGKIQFMAYYPHNYDVVPDDMNPEKAAVYVLSAYDKMQQLTQLEGYTSKSAGYLYGNQRKTQDYVNQQIGDPDDYKLKNLRMVWWSEEFHFTTNGKGEYIDPDTNQEVSDLPAEKLLNPIQMNTFVDIAHDKDFEFWVDSESTLTQFCIELGVMLSDTSNINRLQGYSQAIIKSVDKPQDMQVGPHSVIHLPLDPTRPELSPDFQFVSPSPDLQSSLSLLNTFINLYLSAEGLDSKVINTDGATKTYASGLERLLAMVEKFEASQDDFDLYKMVEKKAFEILKAWNNYLVGRTLDQGGVEMELQSVPEDVELQVDFTAPQALETQKEKQETVMLYLDKGLISKKMAIMDLMQKSDEEADAILEEVSQEKAVNVPINLIDQQDDQEDSVEQNGQDNERPGRQ